MYYFYCRPNLISSPYIIFIFFFFSFLILHINISVHSFLFHRRLFSDSSSSYQLSFISLSSYWFTNLLSLHHSFFSSKDFSPLISTFVSFLIYTYCFDIYFLSISVLNIKFFAFLPSRSRTVSFNVLLFQFPFCALLLPHYLSLVRLELYPAPFCPTIRTTSSLIICPNNVKQ